MAVGFQGGPCPCPSGWKTPVSAISYVDLSRCAPELGTTMHGFWVFPGSSILPQQGAVLGAENKATKPWEVSISRESRLSQLNDKNLMDLIRNVPVNYSGSSGG